MGASAARPKSRAGIAGTIMSPLSPIVSARASTAYSAAGSRSAIHSGCRYGMAVPGTCAR
jgi:hypothetical protein